MSGNYTATIAQRCAACIALIATLLYVYCFHSVFLTTPVLFFYYCGLNSGSLWGFDIFCEGFSLFHSGTTSFDILRVIGLVTVDVVLFLGAAISLLESLPYAGFSGEVGVCIGILRGIILFITYVPSVTTYIGYITCIFLLGFRVRWHALLSWVIVVQSTAVGAAIFLCLKCLFVFLLVVLVRVTTPKFKLETITKLGWLYSLALVFLVFLVYWVGFFLF
jgi:hypothetical protein